jgi:hypothetical protein
MPVSTLNFGNLRLLPLVLRIVKPNSSLSVIKVGVSFRTRNLVLNIRLSELHAVRYRTRICWSALCVILRENIVHGDLFVRPKGL